MRDLFISAFYEFILARCLIFYTVKKFAQIDWHFLMGAHTETIIFLPFI